MKYPQSGLSNFWIQLQRFYDFGRPLICTFVLWFVLLINQGHGGGVGVGRGVGGRHQDLLLFLLNLHHLEIQNCKR